MAITHLAPVTVPADIHLGELATLDDIERQIDRIDVLIADLFRRRFRLVDEWEALKTEQVERREFFT